MRVRIGLLDPLFPAAPCLTAEGGGDQIRAAASYSGALRAVGGRDDLSGLSLAGAHGIVRNREHHQAAAAVTDSDLDIRDTALRNAHLRLARPGARKDRDLSACVRRTQETHKNLTGTEWTPALGGELPGDRDLSSRSCATRNLRGERRLHPVLPSRRERDHQRRGRGAE